MRPDMIGPRRLRPASDGSHSEPLFRMTAEDPQRMLKGIVIPSTVRGQVQGVMPGTHAAPKPQPSLWVMEKAQAEKAYPLGEGPKKTQSGQDLWLETPTAEKKEPEKKISLETAPQFSVAERPWRAGKMGKAQRELIPGGLAGGKPDTVFDPEQVQAGAKVEKEHTPSPRMQKEIARDHLTEDSDYYRKLKRMEAQGSKGGIEDQLMSWLKRHPSPEDSEVHALAGKLGVDKHKLEEMIYSILGKKMEAKKGLPRYLQETGTLAVHPYGQERAGAASRGQWAAGEKDPMMRETHIALGKKRRAASLAPETLSAPQMGRRTTPSEVGLGTTKAIQGQQELAAPISSRDPMGGTHFPKIGGGDDLHIETAKHEIQADHFGRQKGGELKAKYHAGMVKQLRARGGKPTVDHRRQAFRELPPHMSQLMRAMDALVTKAKEVAKKPERWMPPTEYGPEAYGKPAHPEGHGPFSGEPIEKIKERLAQQPHRPKKTGQFDLD